MDRMRDVPSEEYATLHDVYMMLTSQKGSYGMNFDFFIPINWFLWKIKKNIIGKMFFVILLFETFEFSIFAEWLECLLIEASDAFSSLSFKFSTENIFD